MGCRRSRTATATAAERAAVPAVACCCNASPAAAATTTSTCGASSGDCYFGPRSAIAAEVITADCVSCAAAAAATYGAVLPWLSSGNPARAGTRTRITIAPMTTSCAGVGSSYIKK